MVQAGNCMGLTLEALVERRQGLLDSDDAIEAGIARLVDLTHAAGADQLDNLVRTEHGAGCQHEAIIGSILAPGRRWAPGGLINWLRGVHNGYVR
jgi:hypothetical protein